MNQQVILNSKDEPIVLTPREQARVAVLQRQFDRELRNSLGYEINITTLYAISKRVLEQKFFEIPPADYIPIKVGENSWSDNILFYRDFQLGGDFEAGNINTGASKSRLAEADGGVDSILLKVVTWAKSINWSFSDLQMAARSGNWDVVTSKERARKRNWDLGIQKIAFQGSNYDTGVQGLLTQSGVTANTSLITGYINALNAAGFASFVEAIVGDYRSNCNFTAWPTHFVIPELDYNGLATPVSSTYPNVMMLHYLLDAFKLITRNPNFKILPCAYADEVNNASISGLNKNRYTLYNYDEDSLAMEIPVDYTNTMQNTINGFNFENVGYGQYTGALAKRPLEMMYFDFHV